MSYKPTILIVDDDPAISKVLGALLQQEGMASRGADGGAAALAEMERGDVDVVISDVKMPGMDGLELLAKLRNEQPGVPVIMLTAHGTIGMAVDAMKQGAAEFMLKPFDRKELLFVVNKVLKSAEHAQRKPALRMPGGFIGTSAAMVECFKLISKVARGTTTVLVRGESGTGKELVAKAIHEQSGRSGPLVTVNGGALPDDLLESELFGHEKGSFTDAKYRKLGRVELAAGGTLFFDEIGDVTPKFQVKLLRLLQEREFERLGGTQTIKVDVRFVAATHRDLESMVEEGTFREDLFYRLNVVPIRTPALRDRPDDIPALCKHFCALFAQQNAGGARVLDDSALEAMAAEQWPGNVRQLQNLVERLLLLCDSPTLSAADVHHELGRGFGGAPSSRRGSSLAGKQAKVSASTAPVADEPVKLDDTMREAEREALSLALGRTDNNRTDAARILDISRRTLYNKLIVHGIK
jgi:two-component system response regulator AtoC